MSDFDSRLIAAFRRKREAEGLSIRALSAIVGISFSSLARIERGEGAPDNNSKIRLLEWLGSDAEAAGLSFDQVALVHFRAMKNIRSTTVQTLLTAADCIKRSVDFPQAASNKSSPSDSEVVALTKDELEDAASKFREELGISNQDPLNPLLLDVEGIQVLRLGETSFLDDKMVHYLGDDASSEWSAMSVPLDAEHDNWAVLLNDRHAIERQRVTLLEEYWHILLGHKLTKVARVADAYGRTYDSAEEHDAYYLASATLLPRNAVIERVGRGLTSQQIAQEYGTSPELVDYRIKRLGLWREHIGKRVVLNAPTDS